MINYLTNVNIDLACIHYGTRRMTVLQLTTCIYKIIHIFSKGEAC